MNKLVLTTVLLGSVLATAHQHFSLDHGRIIKGSAIDISFAPFQVGLLNYFIVCGGSILSKDYVITAAHCTFGDPAHEFHIYSGSTFRQKGVKSRVLEKYEHPKYDGISFDYDIAILKVEPLNLSRENNMLPVNLPTSGTILPLSTLVSVTGWGKMENGFPSKILLQAVLRTLNPSICAAVYNGEAEFTERMLCVYDQNWLRDSCKGDSGGPLVLLHTNILVGIVSSGRDCAVQGFPGLYTNVAHPEIRQFIKNTTGF